MGSKLTIEAYIIDLYWVYIYLMVYLKGLTLFKAYMRKLTRLTWSLDDYRFTSVGPIGLHKVYRELTVYMKLPHSLQGLQFTTVSLHSLRFTKAYRSSHST